MNIGIIIFSRTGNTLSVAERIRDSLRERGHDASIERVRAESEKLSDKSPIKLTSAPVPGGYDAIIFGAPVEAFSLSPIMKAYMEGMPQIDPKDVRCFVTQHFKKPWLGGNHAVKQMCGLCRTKGVNVAMTGVVNWTSKARAAQINDIASRFCEI